MFQHILIPLDGSSLAECVLPHAIAIARAFGARCTLLRVMELNSPGYPPRPPDLLAWKLSRAKVRSYLGKVAARLQAAGINAQAEILEGYPGVRIIEFARRENVDLILMSSHGRTGLSPWNVSSITGKVIQNSPVSMMIVRAYQPNPEEEKLIYKRILVPLDGSQRAEFVLSPAVTLATHHQASLVLVQAVRKPEMPRRSPPSEEELDLVERLTQLNLQTAENYLGRLKSHLPDEVETLVLETADVSECLHQLAESSHVDLVMLSAHGYVGREHQPFGSIAMNFILYGHTPLLILQDLLVFHENDRWDEQALPVKNFEEQ
jgi:nucleotide-binding universal stress UspA family protein